MVMRLNNQTLLHQTFNQLTVIGFAGRGRHGRALWLCQCTCATFTTVGQDKLKNGHTKSCGCRHRKHGLTRTPEFKAWDSILQRCLNPLHAGYHNYGGRGITICKGWQSSALAFYKDVGKRPSPKHSIDRIDNNGHYSCGYCEQCAANSWSANCRWSTVLEQSRNRRTNTWYTVGNVTLCRKDWMQRLGIDTNTLRYRLKHWTVERALTEPSHYRRKAA